MRVNQTLIFSRARRVMCTGAMVSIGLVGVSCSDDPGDPSPERASVSGSERAYDDAESLVRWLASLSHAGAYPSVEDEHALFRLCHAESEGQQRYLESEYYIKAPRLRAMRAIDFELRGFDPGSPDQQAYPFRGCWRVRDAGAPQIELSADGRRATVTCAPSSGTNEPCPLELVEVGGAWRISGYTFEYGDSEYSEDDLPAILGVDRGAYRAAMNDLAGRVETGAFTDSDTAVQELIRIDTSLRSD